MIAGRFWGWLGFVAVAAGWLSGGAQADEPRSPPRRNENAPATRKLVVKVDPTLKVSKLILPAGMAAVQPAANKGAFWSRTRTMLAGLCLSLAATSLIFVRSIGGTVRMLLIAVTGVAVLGLGVAAWANAPNGTTLTQDLDLDFSELVKLAEGQVLVETGRADDPIILIIAGSAVAPPQLPRMGNALPGTGQPESRATPKRVLPKP